MTPVLGLATSASSVNLFHYLATQAYSNAWVDAVAAVLTALSARSPPSRTLVPFGEEHALSSTAYRSLALGRTATVSRLLEDLPLDRFHTTILEIIQPYAINSSERRLSARAQSL